MNLINTPPYFNCAIASKAFQQSLVSRAGQIPISSMNLSLLTLTFNDQSNNFIFGDYFSFCLLGYPVKQIVLGNLSYPYSSHRERSDHFVLYDSSFDIPLICIGDLGLYMYVEFS